MPDPRRRRCPVVHPRHVRVGEHAEIDARASAGDVFNQQIRIAAAQRVEDVVQRLHVREIAVAWAVSVPRAVAVDPEVAVPFQVVRPDPLDQRGQLIEHPLASRRAGQTDLRVLARPVVAVSRRKPRLAGESDFVDPRQRHALRFDPDAELQPEAVRVVREAGDARRKAEHVLRPCAETRLEVVVVVRAGAHIPAGVEDHELHAERRRAVDFRDHLLFVDLRAIREPGVVGDEWLERPALADAVDDEIVQGTGFIMCAARGHTEERVRDLQRLGGRHRRVGGLSG